MYVYIFFPFHENIKCCICWLLFFLLFLHTCLFLSCVCKSLEENKPPSIIWPNIFTSKKTFFLSPQPFSWSFLYWYFVMVFLSFQHISTYTTYCIFEILFYIKSKLSVKIVHSIKSDSRVWFILPQWRCLPFGEHTHRQTHYILIQFHTDEMNEWRKENILLF